jgi:anti-anti-sigma factor
MADHGTAPPPNNSGPPLTVQYQQRGPAMLVQITGEVDLQTAGLMHDALTTALTTVTAPHPVVVDLTGISFFGSAGLAELLQAHQHATNNHVPLRIVATSRAVLRPLEITGIAPMLDLCRDITTALTPSRSTAPDQQAQ